MKKNIHVSESAESYGLGGYFGKKNYKDGIQTKNFRGRNRK